MNHTAIALLVLVVAGAVAAMNQCSGLDERPVQSPVAKPNPAQSFAEKVGEEVRKEREAREHVKSQEFAQNRGKIIAEIRRLIGAKKWDKAETLAFEYRHVGDAELAKLEDQATTAIRAKQQAEAKAFARKQGVTIGMSKEQALASSWGKPQKVNRTISAYGEREQWVYGGSNYLYFENGTLTSIQN